MDNKKICTLVVVIIIILIIWYLFFSNNQSNVTNEYFKNTNNNSSTAVYNVTFMSEWGNNPKEINAPPNPHTGNMFLITQNGKIKLFNVGSYAIKGISNTSMYGTIDDLMMSFMNNNDVGQVVTAPVLKTPGQTTLTISADRNYHYLSFVTMVAPSPDWFTGISSLNLMPNGQWINRAIIPLFVHDAGTDSGMGFNTEHYLEQNPKQITLKNDTFLYPDGQLKPIAFLRIDRIQ